MDVPVAAAAAASHLEPLTVYAGSWHIRILYRASNGKKARTETTVLRNDCWRSAGYYAGDQFVDGISKALIVFTYDPVHHEYRSYPIPADGGAAGSGRLLISGDTWTFPWQERVHGKSTSFRVVNVFVSRDAIAYRQESSTDGVHWIASATGFERRVRADGERRS